MHTFSDRWLTSRTLFRNLCTLSLNLLHTVCPTTGCPALPGQVLHPPALLGRNIRVCVLFFGIPASAGACCIRQQHARWQMKSVAAMYTRDLSPRWRPAGAGRDQALVQAPSVEVAESARRAAGALLLSISAAVAVRRRLQARGTKYQDLLRPCVSTEASVT